MPLHHSPLGEDAADVYFRISDRNSLLQASPDLVTRINSTIPHKCGDHRLVSLALRTVMFAPKQLRPCRLLPFLKRRMSSEGELHVKTVGPERLR